MKSTSDPKEACAVTPTVSFYKTATLEEAATHFNICYICQVHQAAGSFTGRNNPGLQVLVERFGLDKVVDAFGAARRKRLLFAGALKGLGGVELVRVCPEEFKRDNPWSAFAVRIFKNSCNMNNWRWKSTDEGNRRIQLKCLWDLCQTHDLNERDKEAVGGWMLSEMLTEVPEYVMPKGGSDGY